MRPPTLCGAHPERPSITCISSASASASASEMDWMYAGTSPSPLSSGKWLAANLCRSLYPSGNSLRGRRIFSSLPFSLVKALLIPSSNSKRTIVAPASITTPRITNIVVTDQRWPARHSSQIIPKATSAPPTRVAEISTSWGADGSMPPEKNWWIYVEIAAPLIWLFAAVLLVTKIIRRLWWRR